MKKALSLFAAATLSVSVLASCAYTGTVEQYSVSSSSEKADELLISRG